MFQQSHPSSISDAMCSRDVIFRAAGAFILLSLVLATLGNSAWLLFTAVVGVNLLQSSFTHFCPLERMLGSARLFGCVPHGQLATGGAQ